jgi:hypothetical protein
VFREGDKLDFCLARICPERNEDTRFISGSRRMKNRLHRLFSHSASFGLAVTLLATSAALEAKDTVSPAVGFLRFDCLSGSDTYLSIPF